VRRGPLGASTRANWARRGPRRASGGRSQPKMPRRRQKCAICGRKVRNSEADRKVGAESGRIGAGTVEHERVSREIRPLRAYSERRSRIRSGMERNGADRHPAALRWYRIWSLRGARPDSHSVGRAPRMRGTARGVLGRGNWRAGGEGLAARSWAAWRWRDGGRASERWT
jgi:hypothetical protein